MKMRALRRYQIVRRDGPWASAPMCLTADDSPKPRCIGSDGSVGAFWSDSFQRKLMSHPAVVAAYDRQEHARQLLMHGEALSRLAPGQKL